LKVKVPNLNWRLSILHLMTLSILTIDIKQQPPEPGVKTQTR